MRKAVFWCTIKESNWLNFFREEFFNDGGFIRWYDNILVKEQPRNWASMKINFIIWVGSRLMFFCFVQNFWLFYLMNLMEKIWVNFNIIHDFIIEIFQQIIKFLLTGFLFIMQITDLIVEFVILSILIVFWNQFDNNYFIEKW
jgi:hypothetical protein